MSLDEVKTELAAWRLAKKHSSEKIPESLWKKISILLRSHTSQELRRTLSLTLVQIERRQQLEKSQDMSAETNILPHIEPIDFCEAQEKFSSPLDYRPAEAFATNTSIVELRRPDGMLMKIHICTDRFEELLRAFFKG